MSNFEFLLILLFCNSIILIGLVLRSIKKKSPRIILKFFFSPIILCLIGLFIDLISDKEIKSTERDKFLAKGLRSYVLYPNITGIIFFLTGLQVLALGGVGSEWSFIGLLIATFIIYKILIPKIESNLLKKYPDYSSYINKMPKIFSFKKIT